VSIDKKSMLNSQHTEIFSIDTKSNITEDSKADTECIEYLTKILNDGKNFKNTGTSNFRGLGTAETKI